MEMANNSHKSELKQIMNDSKMNDSCALSFFFFRSNFSDERLNSWVHGIIFVHCTFVKNLFLLFIYYFRLLLVCTCAEIMDVELHFEYLIDCVYLFPVSASSSVYPLNVSYFHFSVILYNNIVQSNLVNWNTLK